MLCVSKERFRGAHKHVWLSGRGQKIFGGINIVRLGVFFFTFKRIFVTVVDFRVYCQIPTSLVVGLVRIRLDGLCRPWSKVRHCLGEYIESFCVSGLGPTGRFHICGHLVESQVILILQNRYVLRLRNMKRNRTFRGESLCSVVGCLRERRGSHRWKGNEEMRLMGQCGECLLDNGQASYRGEGCRDVNRRSE